MLAFVVTSTGTSLSMTNQSFSVTSPYGQAMADGKRVDTIVARDKANLELMVSRAIAASRITAGRKIVEANADAAISRELAWTSLIVFVLTLLKALVLICLSALAVFVFSLSLARSRAARFTTLSVGADMLNPKIVISPSGTRYFDGRQGGWMKIDDCKDEHVLIEVANAYKAKLLAQASREVKYLDVAK